MVGEIIAWVALVPTAVGIFVTVLVIFTAIGRALAWSVRTVVNACSGTALPPVKANSGGIKVMPVPWSMNNMRRLKRELPRAQWRDRSGLAGWRGRRAFDRLSRVSPSLFDWAAGQLWRTWRYAPDDTGWELLCRWQPEQATHDLLAAAVGARATRPGQRTGGDRAALAAFCVRHGLAPEAPGQRALFYTLTGQPAQRRAIDPDGTLLAAAYRAATPEMRAALREALAGEGDLSVVRLVVAGTGVTSRAAELTAEERRYLVARLAGERDWTGLWALAQELTVLEAAKATAMIDQRWRPERQRERELYALLTELPVSAVEDAWSALTVGGAMRLEVPGTVVAGALSPGGRRLAVATATSSTGVTSGTGAAGGTEGPGAVDVSVFRLPDGKCVSSRRLAVRHLTALLYANGKQLFAIDPGVPSAGLAGAVSAKRLTRVFRCFDDSRPRRFATWPDTALAVVARRQGMACLTTSGHLVFHHRADQRDFPRLALAGLAGEPETANARAAIDLGSGRIALTYRRGAQGFGTRQQVLLVEAQRSRTASVLARYSHPQPVTAIITHGRDHVIAADPHTVQRLRADGTTLRTVASRPLQGCRDLVLRGAGDEACALDGSGAVVYLNAQSLETVTGLRELTERRGTSLWSAADNSCHALGGDRRVDVVTRELLELKRLVDRPAATWQPADLIAATRARAPMAQCPAARPLYALLTSWLEHRFADDVKLGRGAAATSWSDDDIAIGEPVA